MKNTFQVCLAAILSAAATLSAQRNNQYINPSQLEVNLGGLAVDKYDSVSTTYDTASGQWLVARDPYCNAATLYRDCINGILAHYALQGVVGVRVQFELNGQFFSTPFTDLAGTATKAGVYRPAWLDNAQSEFEVRPNRVAARRMALMYNSIESN